MHPCSVCGVVFQSAKPALWSQLLNIRRQIEDLTDDSCPSCGTRQVIVERRFVFGLLKPADFRVALLAFAGLLAVAALIFAVLAIRNPA